MKKNVSLSLLMGAALAIPTLVVAAPANSDDITPADMNGAAVDNTLQAEVEGPDGELLATQPGEVELTETEEENVAVDNTAAPITLNQQHSSANYQPMLLGEATSGSVTPADERTSAAPITLQEKKKDNRGELLATQPAEIEANESRRVVAR